MMGDGFSGFEKLTCSGCGNTVNWTPWGDGGLKCAMCGTEYTKKTLHMILEDGEQSTLLRRAEQFEKFKDYRNAVPAYEKYADQYPFDYHGWYGLTRLVDWEKWLYQKGTDCTELPVCCERAIQTADEKQKLEIQKYIQKQIQAARKAAAEKRKKYTDAVAGYEKQIQELETAAKALSGYQSEVDRAASHAKDKAWKLRKKESLLRNLLVFLGFILIAAGLFYMGSSILGVGCVLVLLWAISMLIRFIGRGLAEGKSKRLQEEYREYDTKIDQTQKERYGVENALSELKRQHDQIISSSYYLE
ncbi:MAG: hypothetical protein IJ496_00845 [Ruminococcus sp.]|nr:hypothetical protein [Ruminococcus sp.]